MLSHACTRILLLPTQCVCNDIQKYALPDHIYDGDEFQNGISSSLNWMTQRYVKLYKNNCYWLTIIWILNTNNSYKIKPNNILKLK